MWVCGRALPERLNLNLGIQRPTTRTEPLYVGHLRMLKHLREGTLVGNRLNETKAWVAKEKRKAG